MYLELLVDHTEAQLERVRLGTERERAARLLRLRGAQLLELGQRGAAVGSTAPRLSAHLHE